MKILKFIFTALFDMIAFLIGVPLLYTSINMLLEFGSEFPTAVVLQYDFLILVGCIFIIIGIILLWNIISNLVKGGYK